ncbi:MAG TPA: hypothetical protein VMR41_05770, partial [Patescibacteria group bacterium]|nr:hypothetical protein [Patescibacteria group bacterium]
SLICLANAISSFLSSGSKEIIFTGLLVCPVFWEKSNFNRKLIYEKYNPKTVLDPFHNPKNLQKIIQGLGTFN